jgi:hypothetical protein
MSHTILAIDLGKCNRVPRRYDPGTRTATFRTARTAPADLDRVLTRRPVAVVVFETCSQAAGFTTSAKS